MVKQRGLDDINEVAREALSALLGNPEIARNIDQFALNRTGIRMEDGVLYDVTGCKLLEVNENGMRAELYWCARDLYVQRLLTEMSTLLLGDLSTAPLSFTK